MEIAMGAIGPLLPKLGELLMGELTMEKKVRRGIESLVTELELMHAVLNKVSKVPADQLDVGVKIWAGKVKELSYQMEDIVDSFMVRVEDGGKTTNPKNRVKKILKKVKKLFKNGKDLHRISDALEEVLHQAKQLAELRQRYEQDMRDTSAGASVDPRLMALYTDVTKLVGIEETRDKLINMLIEGDDWSKHPLKTISIVGFGGLGKTTLAKAAYDKIKVKFDCGAFVSVSQNPDMKKVFKDILYGLDKVKYENIHNAARDEMHLIDDIIEFLNDKRYLIIIDDIWNVKAWELIKCAFSKESPGSRLITTTRIVSVSEACCSSEGDIYRMEPLSDDVSRTLFCKRVFSNEEGCPQELVQVTEDILKKCGGIPLAIITIASLLANKHQHQWYALLSSIGHGLTEDRSLKQMKKILLFSYYDLPSHLKPCLLYLSIFPEDQEIMRDRLIWRWISEGLVYSDKQETSLYELADSYFNELVNRSMIQPIGITGEGKVLACRVHDMVLDLICSLSTEENFVTILDGTGRKMPSSEVKVRRLSIQNSKIDMGTTRMQHMRSVTVFSDNVVGEALDISSFQVLRVLDLEGCENVSDVGYVGNLLHLRYLGLQDTHVEDLPREIGKLQFLLTLDLRGTKIEVLPSSVVQLRRLTCLYVDYRIKLPSGIGKLTSLEVLDELGLSDVDLDFVRELGHLTKLRVLRLDCNGFDESLGKALEESISNIYKLNSLDVYVDSGLINCLSEDWVPPPQLRRLAFRSNYSWFETLPSWINPSSLPLLSYLDITLFEVRSKDIQLLGTLPALQAKQLAEQRQRYELVHDIGVGSSIDPRVMALDKDVTELVGIEDTRDELINMLIEGDDWLNNPLKTISIVGFYGLGKTTLAKAAYDNIKVQFNCHAFVSVSRSPDIKKVFKNVLYKLDKHKYAHIRNKEWEEIRLILELAEFLNGKRYLIVIDDIWDKGVWKLIKCAFSLKSPGSRLMITTSIFSVATACCSSEDDIYRMEPLSHDVSRRLFCKRVFSHEEGCPQELFQASEDILKKCGGIPLAIITIASSLASNHQIKTKDQWYAFLNSIGRGLTENQDVEEMKKILLFSYYDLPSHLKPCLLYLSIFPEDQEIMRDRLIWRWISEGLVYSDKQETSLYELADSYFNELVNRSMIQPIGITGEGKVLACRVHDMVLYLICSLSTEENFVTILDGTGRKMPNSEIKVRRFSIQSSKIDVDTTSRMEHMRSLTILTSDVGGVALDISSFQVLRVLDLEGCKNVSDVGYVGNLLQLRYLGLQDTHVEDLPREIGKLQFLLTLDLRGTKIEVLPSSVVQLRRLTCLYVDWHMKLPSGIGKLTSLEVLDELGLSDVDLDFVKELGHLTKLRVLRLDCDGFDESLGKALEESISNIYKLNSLDVYVDSGLINCLSEDWVPPPQLRRLAFESGQSWFETLPSWINPSSLPLLSYLDITVFEVRSEAIQLLGTLPALVYLEILNYSSVYEEEDVVEAPVLSSGALFPCVTVCRFYGIGAVPSMFPRGAAPRLKRLWFTFPAKWMSRENIDLGMWHLPSLQRVKVDLIGEGASEREVDEAKAALSAAAEDHPNRLALNFW